MNQLVQQVQEQGESKEQRSTTKALEREVAHYKRLVKELRRGNDDPDIAVVGGREVEESLSRPVSVVSHIQVDTIITLNAEILYSDQITKLPIFSRATSSSSSADWQSCSERWAMVEGRLLPGSTGS